MELTVQGFDFFHVYEFIQENTPSVINRVNAQDGPATSVMEQNDLKVTVEKDLVSQAEEEDMEALLGTYVLSII